MLQLQGEKITAVSLCHFCCCFLLHLSPGFLPRVFGKEEEEEKRRHEFDAAVTCNAKIACTKIAQSLWPAKEEKRFAVHGYPIPG